MSRLRLMLRPWPRTWLGAAAAAAVAGDAGTQPFH